MIQAIIVIFYAMTGAEQAYIAELACAKVPLLEEPRVVNSYLDTYTSIYSDGSTQDKAINNDRLILNKNGDILYLSGDRNSFYNGDD